VTADALAIHVRSHQAKRYLIKPDATNKNSLKRQKQADTAIRSVMDLDDILDLLLCTDVETSCNNIMSLKEDLMMGMVDQEDWYVDLTV